MIKTVKFWLEASRWYALPMSIFSWLVVFSYSLLNDGNVLYGFIALVGVCFAHLATNLFDDLCDYHFLKKSLNSSNEPELPNAQRGKCSYILKGDATLFQVFKTFCLYCVISLFIGILFYYLLGKIVGIFVLTGALIVLLYSVLSYIGLSELAVGIAFGPLLFGGVYCVMTGKLNTDVFILSLPTMFFTINLLYTDTFLDKDIDKAEGKTTVVNLFKDVKGAFNLQKMFVIMGYLSLFLIPIFDIADWQVFFVFLTIPLAVDLHNSLLKYADDKNFIPEKKWYHFPFEGWTDIKENRSESFMFRMYQARNLMIYSSVILSLALWFSGC